MPYLVTLRMILDYIFGLFILLLA